MKNCNVYIQVAPWYNRSLFLSTVVFGNSVKKQSLLDVHLLCIKIAVLLTELLPGDHDQLIRKQLQAVCSCRQPCIQPDRANVYMNMQN